MAMKRKFFAAATGENTKSAATNSVALAFSNIIIFFMSAYKN